MKSKQDKEKNFVSAVVYVHDDEERIGSFLNMIVSTLQDNFLQAEIICVNDDSKDKSIEVIREFSSKVENISISVINMSEYHGLELAMNAGIDLAIGDFVFEFDEAVADFSPGLIMEVYSRSLQGYDIVTATPEGKRAASSRLFYSLFAKFSSHSLQLDTERFRILSRRAMNRIASMNKGVPYRKAIYAGAGFPTDSVSYVPLSVPSRQRNAEEREYRERLAFDAMLLFTDVGYRVTMRLTEIMMAFTILVGLYVVIAYFASHPTAGWATTMGFLSFSFLALFSILTIIVKYLQILINLIFKRKRYTYSGIEKLTK